MGVVGYEEKMLHVAGSPDIIVHVHTDSSHQKRGAVGIVFSEMARGETSLLQRTAVSGFASYGPCFDLLL